MDPQRPTVYIDDAKLAADIQRRLKTAGVDVEQKVIRQIMQYQTDNYENLGIIRIVYRKP